MVEHQNFIKIEFILQRIEEIFIRDFPVERVFREILHHEVIHRIYRQQKYSKFEFINLQSAFQNLVIDLYDRLQFNDLQKIDRDCLETFFQHCQQIEQTFAPSHLNTIEYTIYRRTFWQEKNPNTTELLAVLPELYDLWKKEQKELRENKLLLQEEAIDWNLEINRLLLAEIKAIREKILKLENEIMGVFNNLYASISSLNKTLPTSKIKRSIFLEIVEESTDDDYHGLFSLLLLHKYYDKIAKAKWILTDCDGYCDEMFFLELIGGLVFEELYPEIGVHRVTKQQLEPFAERYKRYKDLPKPKVAKTFSIKVNVILQPSLSDIPKIDSKDLKITKTLLNPGSGVQHYALTIFHQPTKIEATVRDRHPSMYLAMKLLIAKIYNDRLISESKVIEENLLSGEFDECGNPQYDYDCNREKTYFCWYQSLRL